MYYNSGYYNSGYYNFGAQQSAANNPTFWVLPRRVERESRELKNDWYEEDVKHRAQVFKMVQKALGKEEIVIDKIIEQEIFSKDKAIQIMARSITLHRKFVQNNNALIIALTA